MNPLWKVILNWYGETHIYWQHAQNKITAKGYACEKLARALNVSFYQVYNHFDGRIDNFKIEEVQK